MRRERARFQVDHAGRSVEQPRVRIPLVDRGRDPPVRLGERLHSADGLARGERAQVLGVRLVCGLPAQFLGVVPD